MKFYKTRKIAGENTVMVPGRRDGSISGRLACFGAPEMLLLLLVLGIPALAQHIPIRSLMFEGNRSIDARRLKSQVRFSREGGTYDADTLDKELRNLERFCQNEGFLQAKIGPPAIELLPDPANIRVAVIRVPVSEGPLFSVGSITVRNVHVFNQATLLQMCPLRSGQAYSRQKVAEWQDKIEDGYRTLGYIRFQSTVQEDIHNQQKTVDCMLECLEGNAYSVGKITVAGDEGINRSDFKRHLLLGEGGLYNPQMISLSIQFLNQMGVYRPIADSDVEVKVDDAKNTVDLVFHLVLLRKPGSAP